MTAPDPRLDEIQARANNPFAADNTLTQADADRDYLLAELRKAHEALERVEGRADRLAKSKHCEDREIAEDLRAAVAAAKGDGE